MPPLRICPHRAARPSPDCARPPPRSPARAWHSPDPSPGVNRDRSPPPPLRRVPDATMASRRGNDRATPSDRARLRPRSTRPTPPPAPVRPGRPGRDRAPTRAKPPAIRPASARSARPARARRLRHAPPASRHRPRPSHPAARARSADRNAILPWADRPATDSRRCAWAATTGRSRSTRRARARGFPPPPCRRARPRRRPAGRA